MPTSLYTDTGAMPHNDFISGICLKHDWMRWERRRKEERDNEPPHALSHAPFAHAWPQFPARICSTIVAYIPSASRTYEISSSHAISHQSCTARTGWRLRTGDEQGISATVRREVDGLFLNPPCMYIYWFNNMPRQINLDKTTNVTKLKTIQNFPKIQITATQTCISKHNN